MFFGIVCFSVEVTDLFKRFAFFVTLLFLSSALPSVHAQTLSDKLRTETAESLASAARTRGSAVRGAILFTQPNLNCTRCHATGDPKPTGPDLTRMPADITDRYLVESLLEPSKVIRKGFESATVVTRSGKTISGRIIEKAPGHVVIRASTGDLDPVRLPMSDIEEIVPQAQSAMPEKLMDQLKSREQFLDLVRYLMELAAAARTTNELAHVPGGQTIAPELMGTVLLREFNCLACHRNDRTRASLPLKPAPALKGLAGRADPHFVERFIASPLTVKPGTTMPDMMAALSDGARQAAAHEITHYLVSLSDTAFEVQEIQKESSKRGRELFHEVGCVACHSPRDEQHVELLAEDSVPLGPIQHKYSLNSLVEFLEDPLRVRPGGRMPRMTLSHWEAIDVASYLLDKEAAGPSRLPFRLNPDVAARGKAQFDRLGCAKCHPLEGNASPPASLPLSEIRPASGCLSGKSGEWPRFDLSASQRKAIQAALTHEADQLSRKDEIAVTLTAFRCLNCHQRDELGGVTADRNPHFQTENPNLGPQGRIPPPLTGVGAKLNTKWMRQVLVSGRRIRPYLRTRMPQYGAGNVAFLVDLFQREDQLPPVEFALFDDQKEMRTVGADLVGTGGLNCIACHTFQLKKAANMPAVDLTEMAERLKKNWFYHYMRHPQRLSRNTIMPSFWPGGQAMRKDILNGQADLQIEAIWQYLLDGRQARTPRGLIREPLELLATDEAVMLRRSYPGIGKRGIGVGYPGQVNLAFDAEQMRMAMIWKGKFADPGGVWRSQGHGRVRPLGDSLMQFAPGPELDDPQSPWIVDDGRPPDHQFKGYSLDARMRPRFRYHFSGVRVEDYPVDAVDPSTGRAFLRRTVTLKSESGRHQLAFRPATGQSLTQTGDGDFLVDKQLRVRIVSAHSGSIVDGADFRHLRIPVTVTSEGAELILEYRW